MLYNKLTFNLQTTVYVFVCKSHKYKAGNIDCSEIMNMMHFGLALIQTSFVHYALYGVVCNEA